MEAAILPGGEPFSAALILGLGLAALTLGALRGKDSPEREGPTRLPEDFNTGSRRREIL